MEFTTAETANAAEEVLTRISILTGDCETSERRHRQCL
jgi:hypothetical protein